MLSRDLEVTLNSAFKRAREVRHEYMTVEHLLLGLLDNASAVQVLNACGADLSKLREELEQFVTQTTPALPEDSERDTQPTLGFQRVLQRAVFHVQSCHGAGDRGTAGPEIRAGVQGRQTAVEPGVTHQGWKAIRALQESWMPSEMGGVFGLSAKPHPLQCCCQGLGRQLGRAAPAGHRCCIGHRCWLQKSSHEGPIDALLQVPKQAGWPQSPAAPTRPGGILMTADELQCLALGMPGPQGVPLAGRFQIDGQGASGAHRPHP